MRRGLVGLALLSAATVAQSTQAMAQSGIMTESLAPPAGATSSTRPLSLQPGSPAFKVPSVLMPPITATRLSAPAITAPAIAPPATLPPLASITAPPIATPTLTAPSIPSPSIARPALPASPPTAFASTPTTSVLGHSSPGQNASQSAAGSTQVAALPNAPGPSRPIIANPQDIPAVAKPAPRLTAPALAPPYPRIVSTGTVKPTTPKSGAKKPIAVHAVSKPATTAKLNLAAHHLTTPSHVTSKPKAKTIAS